MQTDQGSVLHYVLKTDLAPHTIILVVLWDPWTSVSQDTMINGTQKKDKQSLCLTNVRNRCLFFSLDLCKWNS